MNQLGSVFLYFSAFALITCLGLGPSVSLLGKNFRSYALIIAPGVGYALFCFFSVWLSGFIGLSSVLANFFVAGGLLFWSISALWVYRNDIPVILKLWHLLPLLLLVTALMIFIPAIHLGLGNYLGTVNPDFFQSLSLHETLLRNHASFWVNRHSLPLDGPAQEAFPDAFQARFGGVVLSVLLEQLFRISSPWALVLAIMVFLSCLPFAVYFFCRTVLAFEEKAAILSAVFVVMAAPTGMSFLHTFIGQNSALALFPLGISLIYLALKEHSFKIAALVVLVLNAVFYLYVMALPYIVAPFFLLIVFQLIRKDWAYLKFAFIALVIGLVSVVGIHLSVYSVTGKFIHDLFDLLGYLSQSQYYIDFLTEEVFQYAIGVTSYPLSQNEFFSGISSIAPYILISLGGVIAFLYFLMLKYWARSTSSIARAAIFSMLLTYLSVWFKYTFMTKYGYASFKMSAWLQFLFVPFLAWGAIEAFNHLKVKSSSLSQRIPALFCFFFLGILFPALNLASNLDYAIKSYGHDIYHGSIVNSYGISGNDDYQMLSEVLKENVPSGERVAVGFGDRIENFWVSYHLDQIGLKTAVLSHEEIPFEDAYLPDIHSRDYIDSLGNRQLDSRKFYKNAHVDAGYYLLAGDGNLNKEIIRKPFNGRPLWENASFRLFKKSDVQDVLVTGRGFYRVEHMASDHGDWWWPETFRWSGEGGEIYHLRPMKPGQPHRIQFSVIAGLGQATGERTIELWHNGKLFDEVRVNGAARIVSKPYIPTEDVNLIVLKIKEQSVLVKRGTGLWNRDLPKLATPINALFSDIHIWPDDVIVEGNIQSSQWMSPIEKFSKCFQFNGFDVDGWMRDRAELTVIPKDKIASIRMRFLVPGNLNFKFPFAVTIVVNDQPTEKFFSQPGEFEVEVSAPLANGGKLVNIQLIPGQFKKISDGMVQREVLQSIRLSSIKFNKAE